MQLTSNNANFFQCGYNFYVGDIKEENTIVLKDDFIVIGKVSTDKNIFALGDVIVFGDIECKSIYATKDFICIGDVCTESIEVEGQYKIIPNKILQHKPILEIASDFENLKEDNTEQDNIIIENKHKNTEIEKNNDQLQRNIIQSKNIYKKQDINLIYQKYLNKKGDIVFGKILRLEDDNYIVKLDDIEVYLPVTNKERFKINDNIGAYIQSVNMDKHILNIKLAENNRSYITKIIKKEMEVNKYDISKIYIKNINKINESKYVVEILSQHHTQSSLDIISNKLKKYTNGQTIELRLY